MTLQELYEDLYARLSENEELTEIMGEGKILDYMPDDSDAILEPYVVIADTNEIEGRLMNDTDRQVTIRLHIWSDYEGRIEVIQIEQAIEKALETENSGYNFESFEIMRNGKYEEQGVLTLRYYIDR